jgi:hypothetical protein
MASKANKDPNNFEVILLTYPSIVDSKEEEDATAANESTRFPLTGTIDEIGSDIQRIKQIEGINHIIFAYNFVSIGRDISNMIDKSKQLAKFAR